MGSCCQRRPNFISWGLMDQGPIDLLSPADDTDALLGLSSLGSESCWLGLQSSPEVLFTAQVPVDLGISVVGELNSLPGALSWVVRAAWVGHLGVVIRMLRSVWDVVGVPDLSFATAPRELSICNWIGRVGLVNSRVYFPLGITDFSSSGNSFWWVFVDSHCGCRLSVGERGRRSVGYLLGVWWEVVEGFHLG